MNNLKPCPKCMSKIPPWVLEHKDRDGTSNGWYVECESCELTCGKLFDTKEDAIDNWNKRPSCKECEFGYYNKHTSSYDCTILPIYSYDDDFYCSMFEQSEKSGQLEKK